MSADLSKLTREELDRQRMVLADAIVERHYALEPDSWQPFGSAGRDRCVRDAGYHLMYLAEAIGASSTALFSDYVAWLSMLFNGLSFPEQTVLTVLDCMQHVIATALPSEMAAVADTYLAAARAQGDRGGANSTAFLGPGNPRGTLASQYLAMLLRGERRAAVGLVVQAAEAGIPIKDIYLHVFQPAQYEVGRLWQLNRISVAQEHYCTAATQLAMAQLYPYTFETDRIGRRLVATCVCGELHEVGARIVADLFEIEGWDTTYLGANTPAAAVVQTLEEVKPDLLAVSATMAFHVQAVADLIAQVRERRSVRTIPIMVGGYPFNLEPHLWHRVNADGSGADAQQAIAVGTRLVTEAHVA